MKSLRIPFPLLALVALSPLTHSAEAEDTTAALLEAQRVPHILVLKLAGSSWATKDVPFAYSLGDGRFEPLPSGTTFTARRNILIGFHRLNPFNVQVTASEAESEDPNTTQLAQALDKLLGLPKALGLKQGARDAPPSCLKAQAIVKRLDDVYRNLSMAGTAEEVKKWRKLVDESPGPSGVRSARVSIKELVATLESRANAAEAAIKAIEEDIKSTPPAPTSGASVTQPTSEASTKPSEPSTKPNATGQKAGESGKKPTEPSPKPSDPPPVNCDVYEVLLGQIEKAVAIANPRARLSDMRHVIDGLKDLDTALATYAEDGNWENDNYIVQVTQAAPEKIKTVTVQATQIEYTFVDEALKRVEKGKPVSTKVAIRQHAGLIPEVAAGFVLASVRVPTYGTAKAPDGSTVVALSSRGTASYEGAVLLNLVCRCGMTTLVHPLLQLGVSSAGDVPSVLGGIGLRFTRPRRLALSVGAVLAWVKDLDKLRVGDPVTGTSQIDADLKRQPTVKGYFALQYTF